MVRIVFFFILTAAAVTAAVTLADYPGTVRVDWLDQTVELPIGVGLAGVVAIALVGAILFWIFRFIWRLPRALGQGMEKRRSVKGMDAFGSGMVALAAGDAEEAKRHARKAESLLKGQPMTRMLSAQAAQLDGNERAAQVYFEAMLDDPKTEFLGVRGLHTLAAKEGKRAEVLKLSKRALQLKPKSPWAQTTALEAQVNSHLWGDAQNTLAGAIYHRVINREDGDKLKAAILVERSRFALADGDAEEALLLAKRARRTNPNSHAAALCLARRQLENGKDRAAKSTIEKAWATVPGVQLAILYADMGPADEAPEKLLRRMQRLVRNNPDHVESLLAVASAQIGAENYGAARRSLMRVEAVEPTRRVYRLLADLERKEGNSAQVDHWLSKSDRAPEGRSQVETDPARAPERVWGAAPGWRGREIEITGEELPPGTEQVFVGYEGSVPQLPAATEGQSQAVATTGVVEASIVPEEEAPPVTEVTEEPPKEAASAETIVSAPPTVIESKPEPEIIVPEPAAPKPVEAAPATPEPASKTNGSNGSAAHVAEPAKTEEPAIEMPAPAEKPSDTSATAATLPEETRRWLEHSRQNPRPNPRSLPGRKSWLNRPSRSI